MVQILIGRSSGLAGGGKRVLLTLDACLKQDPKYKNQITSYPVEKGLDITDHVRLDPDMETIEGIVSNTPDSVAATPSGNLVVNAYEILLNISGREILHYTSEFLDEFPGPIMVDLIVKNRVMVDMICEEFSAPADPQTGDVINFTMTFKKVRFATVALANISYTSNAIGGPGTDDQLAPVVDKGKQQTETPTADVAQAYGFWFNGKITYAQYMKSLMGTGTISPDGVFQVVK